MSIIMMLASGASIPSLSVWHRRVDHSACMTEADISPIGRRHVADGSPEDGRRTRFEEYCQVGRPGSSERRSDWLLRIPEEAGGG